jgi:hypothetical protein
MRYSCDIEGLEHNYIELSDVWSKKQIEAFLDADIEANLVLLRPKIVSLSLARVDGEPITSADQVTNDSLEEIDFRVFHWFKVALVVHVTSMKKLGEASGWRLIAIVGETATRTKTSPAPS